MAQCDLEQDQFNQVSALPDGTVWGSAQNPILIEHSVDAGIYVVTEHYNAASILLDTTSVESNDCNGFGRGFTVQSYSEDGQLQWYSTACSSFVVAVDGVAADDQGSIYVGGNFSGELTLNGVQVGNLPSTSYFLIKLNSVGEIIWSKVGEESAIVGNTWTSQGLLLFLSVTDSVSFNSNTFYNQSGSITPDRDFVILMLDMDGNIIWDRIMTGLDNLTVYAVSCNEEICLVQGRFDSELIYSGQTLSTNGFTSYQLAFSTLDGSLLWMDMSANTDGVYVNSSTIVADSMVVSVGIYHDMLTFDEHTISENGFGSDGFILFQSIVNGSVVWLKSIGGTQEDAVYQVSESEEGFVIAASFASPSLVYEGETLINHSAESNDPLIMEMDYDGKPVCIVQDIGTLSNEHAVGIKVIDADLYVILSFSDSTTFGDSSLNAVGSNDMVIWKTCLPCDTLVGLKAPPPKTPTFTLSPNPTNTTVTLETTDTKPTTITITDVLGKEVYRSQPTTHNPQLDISHLQPGIYIVTATTENGQRWAQKLVVQRP